MELPINKYKSTNGAGKGWANRLPRGFALIATISVMVLLVMVALAMLSLSTIELRGSRQEESMQQARANARLALMMALGELQKSLGPDQRISANASVFDASPESEALTGVAHPNYLAVMDSWDTFLNEDKYARNENGEPGSSKIAIGDTYQHGRHQDLFRRYLASHASPSLLGDYNAALNDSVLALDDDNSVYLYGEGSTGSTDVDKLVRAGLVDVKNASGTLSGRNGWWVGGLNSRAPLDLSPTTSSDASLAGQRDYASEPHRFDVSHMQGLGWFDGNTNAQKRITSSQADIGSTNDTQRNALHAQAFNLGAGGQWSLLTDVRGSGMKKDLNSFFELDWNTVPTEYRAADLAGANIEAPLRPVGGLADLNPTEKNAPPTSWRQLKDYYSLYLQDSAHPNHLGLDNAHLSWNSGGVPISDSFTSGQTRRLAAHHHDYTNADTLSYARMPVVARWIYIISLSSVKIGTGTEATYDLYVNTNPVIVLWNPYSTMLRIENRGTSFVSGLKTRDSDFMIQPEFHRALALEYKAYKNDAGGTVLQNWKEMTSTYGVGSWKDVYFKGAAGSGDDVLLKPGEVKIFSFDSSTASGTGHEYFTAGFDPSVAQDPSQRFKVGTVSAADQPSISIRFKSTNQYGSGTMHPQCSTVYGGPTSAFGMDSTGQVYGNSGGKAVKTTRGHRGGHIVDWFSKYGIQIIPDAVGERAQWTLGNAIPTPQAAVGVFIKSATELPEEDGTLASSKDVRSRNWLHSNPCHSWSHILKPDGLKRTNFPYEIHYDGNLGGNGVAALLQTDGDNAYIGASIEAADGTNFFTYQELPIAPVTNLAALSGMRLINGKTTGIPNPVNFSNGSWGQNAQYAGSWTAAFGLGIGNSYAHPMIEPDKIYTSYADHENYTNQPVYSNQWDNLLMANDGLWDSWYCSSLAPQSTPAYGTNKTRNKVVNEFVDGSAAIPNHRLSLYKPMDRDEDDIISELESDTAYLKAARYMMVRSGFNVNTASVDAWKALLHGLKGREVPFIDAKTLSKGTVDTSGGGLVLSRFGVATGDQEGSGPGDENSWRGIRRLTDDQIDRLAVEMVKQVKLRGPFLNMSEFINRRLSNDRFGVCGALQAAIDWDEFDNNYNGAGSNDADSINGRFKGSNSSVTSPAASFSHTNAAHGSRYAGIPGYVMQSDLLRALGNTLTVRDDSFVIRAYGESVDAQGNVVARAWCEAVVQRIPEYLNHDNTDNAPENPAYITNTGGQPTASPSLSSVNRTFGRKFKTISFRWLSKDEVL
ncbi:MAG: hypothetical protein HN759_10640 [Akkermansiaceae bacterium]|jgi:type II secretory pathway pseudopilin PulG|nr:hypothetical protein [Akkermansiaceae bacterium]